MLKVDLHLHAREDQVDCISYSAKRLIDIAAKKNYSVLAFTFHDSLFYPLDLVFYAKSQGILLLPAIERTIEKKHVLLYNFSDEELLKINSFSALREVKKEHHLVIAPHPFFVGKCCLGGAIFEHADLFDAIEHSYFFTRTINCNRKAVEFSRMCGMPLIAASDLHILRNFGRQYAVVDGELTVSSVISAIKEGKVQNRIKPLSGVDVLRDLCWMVIHRLKVFFRDLKV